MEKLWNIIIKPIIEGVNSKIIVEIGSEEGINTKNILEYCKNNNARMIAIDPFPSFDLDEFKTKYGDKFIFYQDLSLNILPSLKDYDTILIDGDHNWYTVYNELKVIEKNFKEEDFPLIFLHDVGWPYARRDLYYNPDDIPSQFRQPFKKLGIMPNETTLKQSGGLNAGLCNAVEENNEKNGVLTGVEDFINESKLEFSFEFVDAFFGLGILFVKNEQIDKIVKKVLSSNNLVGFLENERIELMLGQNNIINQNNVLKNNLNDKTIKNDILTNNLKVSGHKLEQTKKELKVSGHELEQTKTRLKDTEKSLAVINNVMSSIDSNEKIMNQMNSQLESINTSIIEVEYHDNINRSFSQRLISKLPSLYILLNNKKSIKNTLINLKGYRVIKKNNLFDVGYYLKSNNDIRLSGKDPLLHYIFKGYKEGRIPSRSFDVDYYVKRYPDVKNSNLNPLIHYSLYGIKEGRKFRKNEKDNNNKTVPINKNSLKVQDINKSKKINELRIGYVLWDFPTFSQTFVMNELRWLVENNYKVKVFYKGKPDKEAELDFNIESIQIRDADDLIRNIKEFDINLLHTHFAYPTCTELTYPAAQETGVPFTLSAHALDIFHHENDRRNKIGEMGQSKYCKRIFVPGNFHYEYLVERGVPSEKLMFLRQATNYEIEETININSPRFKRGINNVITIARFVEKKGIDTLIDAAKILEDENLNFKIYGYGPLEEDLKKQITELNLKNVTIEGPIEGNESLKKVYQNGDIFVLPCRRTSNGDMDGIPTVIFEAMAYGIPIITTNVSCIPEFVISDYCGFITNSNEPESLAKKILYVRDMDKNQLNSIMRHGQELVQKNSSVEENIKTMLDIWENNRIDLFMVTYQRGSYKNIESVKEILDRIFKHTTTEFDLTIVDNNSDKDFKNFISEYAKKHDNIRLIFLQDNIMCAPASNVALEAMNNKYAIYLCSNEAFILKHGWERNAINYMEKNKKIGLAGSLAYSPSYYDGKTYKNQEFFEKFRNKNFIEDKDDFKIKHVQGGVYILRRKAYEEAGGFNPLLPQDHMDVEYSYYLQSNGWKLGEIPEWISSTIRTLPKIYTYLDENTSIVHPLTLEDLNKINEEATEHCNICNGKLSKGLCKKCGSDSSERAIYRIIGKSDKGFRSQRCTLLLNHNTIHKELGKRMFTLVNTDYAKKDLEENSITMLKNLDETDVLITNLEFKSDYPEILKMMIDRLSKNGLLVFQLSNNESLNNELKEFLSKQKFNVDKINFINNKLTKNSFLVAERIPT